MLALMRIAGLFFVVVIALVLWGFFAPVKIHHKTTLDAENFSYETPDLDNAPFVGLALSGGGSRAAVFGTAGMHELAKLGKLQNVTHVSSVSGGGFAASYFALNEMPECNDIETAAPSPCDTYFAKMQSTLAHNFFDDIQWNQVRNPTRLFSPSRRLTSLQHALDQRGFLFEKTFADLPNTRAFYFNTVSYNTGRRFVLSNAALPAPETENTGRFPERLRTLSFSEKTTQRPAPGTMPISLAVATSAAFPPYLGPMTVQINNEAGEASEYWHLGDGGLLENPGIETLREAIYARDDAGKNVIYSMNAGLQMQQDLSKRDISVFSRDLVQFVNVLVEYSSAQRETLYPYIDEVTDTHIEQIDFIYTDVGQKIAKLKSDDPRVAQWTSWDSWSACGIDDHSNTSTPASYLQTVPTDLEISACDEALIAEAARFLVRLHFGVPPA